MLTSLPGGMIARVFAEGETEWSLDQVGGRAEEEMRDDEF